MSVPSKRIHYTLQDGDKIDVVWVGQSSERPIIFMLHGYEGSIQSSYITGMIKALDEAGYQIVFLHFRSCGSSHQESKKRYHMGSFEDINAVIKQVLEAHPNLPFGIMGFSFGGAVMLQWLIESDLARQCQSAIGISIPFSPAKSIYQLSHGSSRWYQRYLLKNAKKKVYQQYAHHKNPPVDLRKVMSCNNFVQFDDLVTAPLHGFKSAKDYYETMTFHHKLKSIPCPTLLIHAKDDPITPYQFAPHEHELPPHVYLEVSKHGGHVGFMTTKGPHLINYWLEERIPLYFSKYIPT